MCRKLVKTVLLTVALLCLSATLVMADTETVAGTIQEINVEKGTFTVLANNAQPKALKTTAELLEGLKKGDKVEVEIENGIVVAVYKEE